MKSDLFKSIKITFVFCAIFAIFALILWAFAHTFSPNKGQVEVVTLRGKIVGADNVGQSFSKDIYFWGRPSAAGYQADASAGSNKGPANASYLKEVNARIGTFIQHHPYLKRSEVPAEMVTASASGLDPDITPESAAVQIKRVAKARGLSEEAVEKIVEKHIEKPLFGLFGPAKVNVLKLNVALDKLTVHS
ncbi:MAG: K(+)-transporting ATPase subunit C [Bacteroidota bacterium]|nr:K(+)-transporting ATPase subunit C [Bacteroidota bacterium]